MILLVSSETEPATARMRELLAARGAKAHLFDPGRFPARARASFSLTPAGPALRFGGAALDLGAVRSAWYWHPPLPSIATGLPEADAAYARAEARDFCRGLFRLLRCPWLPGPPGVLADAELKLPQLALAAELGFLVPDTLITTDRRALLEFAAAREGAVVTKAAGSAAFLDAHGAELMRYTEPFGRADRTAADAVRFTPIAVQAAVPKALELRVTVVGNRVFAAEIDSQKSRHTRADWRRYDRHATPIRPHALGDEDAARAVALTRRLGLGYGAIDLILTPDGRRVFLEINPSGRYGFIEAATGLPISEAIADELVRLAGGVS